MGAVDEAQKRQQEVLHGRPEYRTHLRPARTGDFTVNGRGQFFSPFGGDGTHAVQAQGEYMYYPGHQEGQFDIGLVNRWGNLQAGAFGSFKYLELQGLSERRRLGPGRLPVGLHLQRGRIGLFGTQGFKNTAVLNSVPSRPGIFLQTYAQDSQPVWRRTAWSASGAMPT